MTNQATAWTIGILVVAAIAFAAWWTLLRGVLPFDIVPRVSTY